MTSTASEEPVSILLVDDRQENLVSLKGILTSRKYRLLTASCGEDALKIALREDLAVILLDVVMPGMDGLEVARHLKKLERTSRVPILFLTAVATDVEQIYKAYSVGAVDYLIKPLDKDVVRKKVAVFVDLHLQRREIERQARVLRETERREYELSLARLRLASDNRYRKLVEGIDHAIAWSMDAKTNKLSFISTQAERILGYSADEFTQEDFWGRHVLDEDRTRLKTAFRQALEQSEDRGLEHGVWAAGRRRVWFHTGLSAIREADGSRCELHGISVDVTGLKRLEESERLIADVVSSLAENFEYGSAMSRLAHVLVPRLGDWCVIDVLNGDIIQHEAVAHTDASKEPTLMRELASRPSFDLRAAYAVARVLRTGQSELHADISDVKEVAEALGVTDSDVLRGLDARSYMIVPLRARGQTLAAMTLVSSQPHRFDFGDLAHAEELGVRAALAIDNARLYRDAQRAKDAREDILRVVSHDLKNPLSVIGTSVEYLMSLDDATSAQARKLIKAIRRASTRMGQLIDDLLDLERIEVHRFSVERRGHEAASLVRDCLESVEPLASQKSITIHVHADAVKGLSVYCDRGRVLQVFVNLLGNAIKFSPERGVITLRAERDADAVVFAVEDDGPGISQEARSHVFERYWQATETAKLGIGLGLAIAKGIVEAHGGRIWVESELGHGSTFFFALPLLRSAGEEASIATMPGE